VSPAGKAEWLAIHDDDDTLMIGDGLNDAFAVEQAFCSGTPAIDRPFLPARADFYFTTAGLAPIRTALRAARRLAAIHHRNLTIAVAYNVVSVGLAAAGLMSPLLCAVLMPVASLTVVLSTAFSLSRRSPLWKS
jgi:Cu2+-exporting ATPase